MEDARNAGTAELESCRGVNQYGTCATCCKLVHQELKKQTVSRVARAGSDVRAKPHKHNSWLIP